MMTKNEEFFQKENAISEMKSKFFPIAIPLNKPIVDEDFDDLPLLGKVTESIIYNILCLEYSISPKGGLRQWIKINISLFILVGIPIFIFVPLALYFTSGLYNITGFLAKATGFLFDSALNILYFLLTCIAIWFIITIIIAKAANSSSMSSEKARKIYDKSQFQSSKKRHV